MTMDATRYGRRSKPGAAPTFVLAASGVLGRDAVQADYVADDATVSRRHCELTVGRDGVWVRDLGSKNGTWLNGRRVQAGILEPGDRLEVGPFQWVCRRERDQWVLEPEDDRKVWQGPGPWKEKLTAVLEADREDSLQTALEGLRSELGCDSLALVETGGAGSVLRGGSGAWERALSQTVLQAVRRRRTGLWAPRDLRGPGESLQGYAETAVYCWPVWVEGPRMLVLYAFWAGGCRRPEVVVEAAAETWTPAWDTAAARQWGAQPAWGPTLVVGDWVLCLGTAAVFRAFLERLWAVAHLPYPVVLVGERGVGKTAFARVIHEWGPRRAGPFLVLPCPNLSPSLLEAQLFGSRRGAFTGAVEGPGLLEACDGGTLVLDSLESCPLEVQAKLLRVLETQSFLPLGPGVQGEVRADVRFIATTNEDPRELMEQGRLRRDFWDRLSVQTIRVPPLREWREDVPRLVLLLLEQERGSRPGCRLKGFTAEAMEVLQAYDWPGNVRELAGVVRRLVGSVRGTMAEVEDVWAALRADVQPGPTFWLDEGLLDRPYREATRIFDGLYARWQLRRSGGNVRAAAGRSGLSRVGFYQLLRRAGLQSRPGRGRRPRKEGAGPDHLMD
ncbi:Transcriptional regulatory protein GlrR [bacterium HR11]|nr:Transcriptional regulatory protein GlrR [bacterium HR11]